MIQLIFVLVLLATTGCSLAPQTMPMNAHALGDGNVTYGADIFPTPSVRIQRGFGDRLDLGLQIEPAMVTGQAKYSVYQGARFASALYIAATNGPSQRYSAHSFQLGPMFSYTSRRFNALLALRYSSVNYVPAIPDSFGTDEIGIGVQDDKLENYYTADLVFGLRLGQSNAHLKLGATCTSYTLDEEAGEKGVQGCVPVIGWVLSDVPPLW